MQRRTLIQTLIAWLWAQPVVFPGKHEATLQDLAAAVLPESLGRSGTDAVALQFVRWVQEYRVGAELQTGYGTTRVRYQQASPAARYLEQLDQLASGALAQKSLAAQRQAIARALESANVKDLAQLPNGGHIASDLMSFYFHSSEANDRAYLAEVRKDKCRTLKNAGGIPAALKQGSTNA